MVSRLTRQLSLSRTTPTTPRDFKSCSRRALISAVLYNSTCKFKKMIVLQCQDLPSTTSFGTSKCGRNATSTTASRPAALNTIKVGGVQLGLQPSQGSELATTVVVEARRARRHDMVYHAGDRAALQTLVPLVACLSPLISFDKGSFTFTLRCHGFSHDHKSCCLMYAKLSPGQGIVAIEEIGPQTLSAATLAGETVSRLDAKCNWVSGSFSIH